MADRKRLARGEVDTRGPLEITNQQQQITNLTANLTAAQQQSAQLEVRANTCDANLAAAQQQIAQQQTALTQRIPEQGQQIISPQNTLAREIEDERNQFEADAGRHVKELEEALTKRVTDPNNQGQEMISGRNTLAGEINEELERRTRLAEMWLTQKNEDGLPYDENKVALELQAQAQTNGDLKAEYKKCQSDLAALKDELSARIGELETTTEQLDRCAKEYGQLQIQIQEFKTKETALNAEHQRNLDEINKGHTQKFDELQQGYQAALNRNNADNIANYTRLLQEENNRSNKALAEEEGRHNLIISETESQFKKQLADLAAKHNNLVTEIGEKQAAVTEILEKHDDCEQRFSKCEADLKVCNDNLKKDIARDQANSVKLNDLAKKLVVEGEEKVQLRQQFDDLKTRFEELNSQKDSLQDLQSRFEALQAEKDRLQAQFAEDIFGEDIGLSSGLASGIGASPSYAMQVAAPIVRQMTPAQQVDSALNAYASGFAREMDSYSAMARDIIGNAVQENSEFVVDVATMKKWKEEYNNGRLKGEETLPSVAYTVANPEKTFTQYQIDNPRLLEIFAENNCFTCWRNIRANIGGRQMPWTVGVSGALTIADLLIRSLDYTYMILTSTPFMGVFTNETKYPSINKFITQKDALYKTAFASAQSRETLDSVACLTLVTLVVLSLSELIYATYYNPTDCVEMSKPTASGTKSSGGVSGVPIQITDLIFATVNLMCKFLSTKSLLDVGISAVLYKFMKCSLNKGFAFFTSDGSAASDAAIRGIPTYSQITFYVGETTTLSGKTVASYNCKRVFCIDDPAIAGYLWIVKNVMTKYEAFKQTNPGVSIITFLAKPDISVLLGAEESFIFKEIYFMGDPAKQNPRLYSTIYDDATSLASDGEMSRAFTEMLGKEMAVEGQRPTIYKRLRYIGYNGIGYGFDADLYKCSTLSRLMFNKKFGHMTESEFQKYITMTTLDYMRHDYEGKGKGANPSSVRYLLLGLNLMRKMRRFNINPNDSDGLVDIGPDDYNYDYSWVTTLTGEEVTALMSKLQAELTDYDRREILSMSDEGKFKEYLNIYKEAITPAGIFYWPLHPCLVPGAQIKGASRVLQSIAVDADGARKQLFNTYLYMAAKSVVDYEGDLFREELHMYGIVSKRTPRVWLAGKNKLAVKKTHDAVLNNVAFVEKQAVHDIVSANTLIPEGENGAVDLQLSLLSINTQGKSVIGIDATNSADGNSGTTEDPRSTTVVEYLHPTTGFLNGLQICTINSGSNSTGEVYSPEDTSDIEFLYGKMLYSIRNANFVIVEKTAPAIVKQLSGFYDLPEVKVEIAKITLTPTPSPPPPGLAEALAKVEAIVPKGASVLVASAMDIVIQEPQPTLPNAIIVSVLGDINVKIVSEEAPAPTPAAAPTAEATAAVAIFKGVVETQLKVFSDAFGEYLKFYDYTNGKPYGLRDVDYPKDIKGVVKEWPKKAVKDTFIEVIQTKLRPLVTNINTAYNTMLSSISNKAFSVIAIMSINAAVNTIFGILYTTVTSQVQLFQDEQKTLMAKPDVKIRASTREKAVKPGPATNPIAYKPFQGIDIPIFPVNAAVMGGGGSVNDDSHTKGKPKNKDTRSFKVKSDKKTSRKK